MKVVSFLPAATQMIYDMGLQDLLYGVTFECPPTSRTENEILVRCVLEGKDYSSTEIDKIFSASKAQGKSLYYVEEDKLQAIAPDVVITQDVCEVCQIDTKCTQAVIDNLEKTPLVVTLTPQSLEDVFQTVITIATALCREEAAYQHLANLQLRIDNVIDKLREHRALPKRVMLLEWIEPIYNCGHWIPHQIAYAGGVDMLSNPSGDSIVTQWEKILKYDPEVLIIAPCGFDTQRSIEELHLLTIKSGWENLRAVQNKAVFVLDYDLFTQPSASTLVNGIEILAALFHSTLFTIPQHLVHKVYPIFNQTLVT
ncbi:MULTISPECIES: ABC transporter substrate-binding protein [unclassified Arcicella]|uniref:ABC transporter substrate-binding protein n=1 Tax=unclassified Arcicella TaxID=2644986 RepID=UPI00285936F5|nr:MULTISPECIES: ABC transporter substrate-binding protein [unclassified Arcicella]MDR6561362.1 iron complex transport system substrate-binding protein [Arcicella sp. BE51]MDR6811246.1 iron complex transport system substrate-binding protein [Arcicella sp. BE140]MDR6822596.1 iron complex transport system substrate-binding protein [Arcicella sp. BE139]